jgi:hypothetical protein
VPIPTVGQWDRIRKAVRDAEADKSGLRHGEEDKQAGFPGIAVEVTGPPERIGPFPTTTGTGTTATTATTSSTGTTGTTCPPPSTTSQTTTTTTETPKYVYPARLVYRNLAGTGNKDHWWPGEQCWAQESNNGPLGIGCRYPCTPAGEYKGLGVFTARGNGSNLPCSTTGQGTTTSQGCVGVCVFDLDTATGKWVLSSSTCCPSGACDCPQPDFCPHAAGECANTETYCTPNGDQTVELVTCPTTGTGTTGTTSATTSATTTSRDPTRCGTGCSCKYVPGVGNVVVSNNCGTADLGGGCYCTGGCFCQGNPNDPCGLVFASCETRCTPPPPPDYCNGYCDFVSTGEVWILTASLCSSSGIPCACSSPSAPGPCAARTRMRCEPPKPQPTSGTGTGTGTGTTSATSSNTTTSRGGCLDFCLLRWDTGTSQWVTDSSCGASCACEDPPYDGEDDCSVAKVPCKPTTTATTTTTTGTTGTGTTSATSTSSQTTTTTVRPCCGSLEACVYQCLFVGYATDPDTGQQVEQYDWVQCRSLCPLGVACLNSAAGTPQHPCDAVHAGVCVDGHCDLQVSDCGSGKCRDANGDCVSCTDTGMTASGAAVNRCSDCTSVTNVDNADFGETGVF